MYLIKSYNFQHLLMDLGIKNLQVIPLFIKEVTKKKNWIIFPNLIGKK